MELSLPEPLPPKRSQPATKRERISKPVIRACELLASGKAQTIIAAAQAVGLSREHLGKMLQRPHVQAFVANEARRTIGVSTLRASRRLVELLDAKSEHVVAQVADRILTSERILQSDQGHTSVDVRVTAGYVINLAEPAPKVIDAVIVAKVE